MAYADIVAHMRCANHVRQMSPIKVGFVLVSSSRDPLPSTRIAVMNMLPFLREAGFDPHIVFDPPQAVERPDVAGMASRLAAQGFRIIVFQKVHGSSVETLVHELSAHGIRTVFAVCDIVDATMVDITDATIAVTAFLRSLYPVPLQSKIHIVHDGIENAQACKTGWAEHRGSPRQPLRAVLVTSFHLTCLPVISRPPKWLEVAIVGKYALAGNRRQRLQEMRWNLAERRPRERLSYLRFLLDSRIRRIGWDPVGVYEQMREADIGIIPIEATNEQPRMLAVPAWQRKSENRLTMKMSMGLAVIATPIPAYEAVVESGINGFLARTPKDWAACLDALRDPGLRIEMGRRARLAVQERYSMKEQARRLVDVLGALVGRDLASHRMVSP